MKKLLLGMCAAACVTAGAYQTQLKAALIEKCFDAKVAAKLKAAGFEGVELTDRKVTLEEAREAKRLADKEGITIHSFMGGWFKFNEPDKYEAEIEAAKHCIRLTAAYGASVMLTVPVGFWKQEYAKLPPWREICYDFDPVTLEVKSVTKGDNAPYAEYIRRQNEATKAAVKALRELEPLAAELGVVLALENVGSRMWMKPNLHCALVKSFRSPWIKFYYDMGNNFQVGDPNQPCDWIDTFGEEIIKVHIKDNAIDATRPYGQRPMPIGDGGLNFKALRDGLEKIGYNGWVSIESEGRTDAEHAAIMKRFFAGEPVWPK